MWGDCELAREKEADFFFAVRAFYGKAIMIAERGENVLWGLACDNAS